MRIDLKVIMMIRKMPIRIEMSKIKSQTIKIRIRWIKAVVDILRITRMVIKDLQNAVKTGPIQEVTGDPIVVVILNDEEKMSEMQILRLLLRFTFQESVDKHANQI